MKIAWLQSPRFQPMLYWLSVLGAWPAAWDRIVLCRRKEPQTRRPVFLVYVPRMSYFLGLSFFKQLH